MADLVNALSKFRHTIKEKARAGNTKEIFDVCDELRDDVLPFLGIRLEDKGNSSVWKLDDPEVLIKAREKKIAEKEAKKSEGAKGAKGGKKQDGDKQATKDLAD